MVTSNDYEALQKVIQSKSKTDFNCVKSGISLLQKAIEVRSKECFDLLIEIPNLEIIRKGGTLSGIQKALEYNSAAPNISNEYYVNRLLEKDVALDSYTLISTIDHPQIFYSMFNRVEKTESMMQSIIQTSINKNNLLVMESMFNILDESELPFYNDATKKANFDNKVFTNMLAFSTNINAFDFLINRGCNWKAPYSNTALLYYLMNANNVHLFNTVYLLYESLSSEELNQIDHIKNLIIEPRAYSCDSTNITEYIDKIVKLPIKFNDVSGEVLKIFKRIIDDSYYWGTHIKKIKRSNELISAVNKMYKAGIIKSNPFQTESCIPIIYYTDIENYHSRLIKRYNEPRLNEIKQTIRQFLYVCSHYGHGITGALKTKFDLFFTTEQLKTFEADKQTFIESLNYEVVIKVTKKTRKSKAKTNANANANIDIEV
jgi:hypothetical protein